MDTHTTVVVPAMEGVTTAIVAFIFVCVAWPHLVKNKTQFYAAFAATLLILLLHSLSAMIGTAGFQVFAGAVTGLLQLAAIVLLFAAAGGLSVRELTGEMTRAFEVMRRGEEHKTVIIPLTGEQPKSRESIDPSAESAGTSSVDDIQAPPDAGWPKKPNDSSSLPLE